MSSLIKEGKNFLTKEHKKTIQKLLEQNQLSFYMGPAFEQGTNYPYLSHTVLKRPEDRTADDMTYPSKYTKENQFNSIHADIFLEILFAFCDKYKIKINKVFRINVNLTFNIGTKKCPSHVDHEFDHKQLIIYLNDCDKDAKTIMLDENNKISHEITPEKYKGVLFDNFKHYLIYTKIGARIIAIYTFD